MKPNLVEYDADELDVLEGAIPPELDGVYLRNTENPVLPAIGRYHPFDGDGMIHAIRFAGGAAAYRNRFVRRAPRRRPDRPHRAARADLRRHPRMLGARLGAARGMSGLRAV